ncbi:MAG: mtsB [Pseudobdellovibrio sp.]|nr:mtsB [Pseudobdellovibrio sp.]
MLFFQNCGKFNLQSRVFNSSFSSNVDVILRAPTEYAWYRRYIFLVDMSHSMVSGPCPFDADVTESTHGFLQSQTPYKDFDPNFNTPSDGIVFADARARVADCSVDLSLPFGAMKLDYAQPDNPAYLPDHKTFQGHDFQGNRFKILREWIAQMRASSNLEFKYRTQILLVPAAGGIAYKRLLESSPQKQMAFVDLNNPMVDSLLNYFEQVHKETADNALMPAPQRFAAYDPDLDKLKMGTTSLNFAYDNIFTVIDNEMERLAETNDLTHSNFKMVHFGDNRTSPLKYHFDKTLNYFSKCSTCQESLDTAWGQAQDDELETLDLKVSLIQGLNKYYGSGFFDLDFFDLETLPVPNPIVYTAQRPGGTNIGGEDPGNQKDVIPFLDKRSSERKASTRIFKINSEVAPYRIANNSAGEVNFKTTHVFLLNSNFKVDNNGVGHLDSDGDGLPDTAETTYAFDPNNARSNGVCIDVLMTEPGFKTRCETLYASRLCGEKLDSDGDSLNECEELTIGTDPFDFDTDGDGVPDSLEVLYQLNPLYDDNKGDSNGDSLTNVMNLGMGLNPSTLPAQVSKTDLINIVLNYTGQELSYSELFGNVRTDIFTINLTNFPLRQSNLKPEQATALYLLRPGSKGFNVVAEIPAEQQLIKPISLQFTNKLMGLLRIVDPSEPQRVYWETFELPLDTRQATYMSTIDLSLFNQMRVIDRVRLSK